MVFGCCWQSILAKIIRQQRVSVYVVAFFNDSSQSSRFLQIDAVMRVVLWW